MDEWQTIESAKDQWIIGYTSWGQHVGKFHEWVGPCERIKDHYEFVNTDFDMFPQPTHWQPLPTTRPSSSNDARSVGIGDG